MSRGESYGGGHSSLGYLFSSDDQPAAPPATQTVIQPPYGTDITTEKPHDDRSPNKPNVSSPNSHRRAQGHGQNTGNFITDRPSTKVKSVPGGDSSLGYLFGDNK